MTPPVWAALVAAVAALAAATMQFVSGGRTNSLTDRHLDTEVESMLREEIRALRESIGAEAVLREANQRARLRCEAAILAMRVDLALLKAAIQAAGIALPAGLTNIEYLGDLPTPEGDAI